MIKYSLRRISLWTTALLYLLFIHAAAAQQNQQVIQFSGLITATDSTTAIAGAVVYVQDSQRGTIANQHGFFSMPVLAGDSIVVAALGYQKQLIVIPKSLSSHSYSVTVTLSERIHELPEVDVMPWATERDLKEAIMNVKLSSEEASKEINLDLLIEKYGVPSYPMDGTKNAAHGLQQQMQQLQGRYMVPNIVDLLSIPIRRRKK